NLIYAQHRPALRDHRHQIGVVPLLHPPTDVARRIVRRAQQTFGEMPSDGGLSHARRTHEQVGICRERKLSLEQSRHPVVTHHALEPAAHPISSMISSTIASTGRSASTNRTRSGSASASLRSEERRVGKECRARWAQYPEKSNT